MLTGEIRSQVDRIWDSFWSGGISNPIEVIEQITYLLFLRRLDELHTLEEQKARELGRPMARRIFPAGLDRERAKGGRPYEQLRWSFLKELTSSEELYELVAEHVFPFLR